MDPNANLAEQLSIARGILADDQNQTYDAIRLAELVQALDEWIKREGFLPARWGENR